MHPFISSRSSQSRFFLECILLIFLIAVLVSCSSQKEKREEKENKKGLLAILARNKAHVLPLYLKCIENLDYNKKLMTLYVNTNNNADNKAEVLEDWIKKNENQYKKIIFDKYEIVKKLSTSPHLHSYQFTNLDVKE